ncbi:MAG: beta-hydroxyacyl-ACP dehydratase [Pirellulales bacterium]|nr:beta-hydroxyacyl-ACP dehydratase [Pirellulales bacterium]
MRWFWIDRFTEFVSRQRATAVKAVSLSEDFLHDHFASYPIMPNSLVIEGMAQTGGLLVSEFHRFEEWVVLGKVARSLFFLPARPGDLLTYRITLDNVRDGGAVVTATSHIGDQLQAEAELFFANVPAESVTGPEMLIFDPHDLLSWLEMVGVFDIGLTSDGTPLAPSQYHFVTIGKS